MSPLFVAVAALAALGTGGGGDAAIAPAFTLSAAATETLARISYFGSTLPLRIDYTLYGDGRLERVLTDAASPTKREVTTLSRAQVQELMGGAVAHGLATTSQSGLDRKIRDGRAFDPKRQPQTPELPASPPDAGFVEVEIRLTSLGRAPGAVTNRLRLRGLEETARELPAIQELGWWVHLRETFDALLRAQKP